MQMQNIRASLQQRWQRSPFIFKSVFAMNIVVRKKAGGVNWHFNTSEVEPSS